MISNDFKQLLNQLTAVRDCAGSKAKASLIGEYSEDVRFVKLLQILLDPYATYKVRRIESALSDTVATAGAVTFKDFADFTHELATTNANKARSASIEEFVLRVERPYREVVASIITKELSLGAGAKSVNKAIGRTVIPTFACMLAEPDTGNHTFPLMVSLKYDGVRCIGIVRNKQCMLFTRQGRVMHFPAIEKELLLLSKGHDMMFDGEIDTVLKGRTKISGIVNSNLKTGYKDGSEDSLALYLFDVMALNDFENGLSVMPQSARSGMLERMLIADAKKLVHTRFAETQVVRTPHKLKDVIASYIDAGEEGVIIKDPDAKYECKRSKSWLKVKAINSCTLKVVGTEEGRGKRRGKVGALICESADGKIQVSVGSGLSDEMIETFEKESPIGSYVEVLFNVLIRGRDSDIYSLFLPRLDSFRADKGEADTLEVVVEQHIGAIDKG